MTDLAARRAEAEAGRVWFDTTVRLAILHGRITELRSALENYGRHFTWCERNADTPCNCGLDAEIAKRVKMPPELVAAPVEPEEGLTPESEFEKALNDLAKMVEPDPMQRDAARQEVREILFPLLCLYREAVARAEKAEADLVEYEVWKKAALLTRSGFRR